MMEMPSWTSTKTNKKSRINNNKMKKMIGSNTLIISYTIR